MKMILVDGWLALNVEHIASIRRWATGNGSGVTIEMVNGTRHEVAGVPIEKLYAQISVAMGAAQEER